MPQQYSNVEKLRVITDASDQTFYACRLSMPHEQQLIKGWTVEADGQTVFYPAKHVRLVYFKSVQQP